MFFCSFNYKSSRVFRGLEQLYSLFWRRVMAISKLGVIQLRFPFVWVEVLTTFCFLWHNFSSRYARKPIKGSRDSDDNLVSKKNWGKKLVYRIWRGWPRKLSQNNEIDTLTCDSSTREPQTQSERIFFQSQLEDLLNP